MRSSGMGCYPTTPVSQNWSPFYKLSKFRKLHHLGTILGIEQTTLTPMPKINLAAYLFVEAFTAIIADRRVTIPQAVLGRL